MIQSRSRLASVGVSVGLTSMPLSCDTGLKDALKAKKKTETFDVQPREPHKHTTRGLSEIDAVFF